MYKVLDEKVKRTPEEVEKLYPHCKYLLYDVKDVANIEGYLYSVSSSIDSFKTIAKKANEFARRGVLCLFGGDYGEEYAFGILHEVKG